MRILLVDSFPLRPVVDVSEPLSLGYLAGFMRREGHPTDILHMPRHDRARVRRFLDVQIRDYDLVGFSTFSSNFRSSVWLAGRCKAFRPDLPIVFGGPQITGAPSLLAGTVADYAVRGEGEETLRELVARLEAGRDASDVRGTAAVRDGVVRLAPPRPRIRDVDSLPFAHRDGLPHDEYGSVIATPWESDFPRFRFNVFASRGCPNRCKFCASAPTWRGEWYPRAPALVVAEMTEIYERHGDRTISFYDPELGVDRDHLLELAEAIRATGVGFRWSFQTSPELLDEGIVEAMRTSGCLGVSLGVDSASRAVLDPAGKPDFDLEAVLRSVAAVERAGMTCVVNFVIGLPWESKATLRETRAFVRRLPASVAVFAFARPFPGTVLNRIARTQGWITDVEGGAVSVGPSMPTFHLSRREVRIGFWRCLLAFYASPGFFRRVRRAARRGKGSGIDVRVLLGILLNIALLAAKGVATDLRDRVARWRGRDPYFE